MVNVVTAYVFNADANRKRNHHVFHMTKANLGHSLKTMDKIAPDKKFQFIAKLDSLLEHDDLDCDSFNKLLYQTLSEIRLDITQEIEEFNNVNRVIDSLIKHFNLWSAK